MDDSSRIAKAPLDDTARWNLLQVKIQEKRASDAVRLFRDNGVEPILIKGIAVGQYYPGSEPRLCVDTDLAVSPGDFNKASLLLRSPAADGLAIDLHRGLRHLDTVAWEDLFANSVLIAVDGGSLRVPRPEDHLRIVCVHWLTDGARERSRLADIYYLVANRPADFDWSRFLDVISNRRQRWMTIALGMAERYFDLDLSGTPLAGSGEAVPKWVIETAEREWSGARFVPLEAAIFDRKIFVKELAKRFQVNPIWATVQMDGSFDARTRFFYKLGSFFGRIGPSYKRISETWATRK